MDQIHVKNLEKYQPKYNDGRHLVWIRWNIHSLRQYNISKLTPSQRWLFIALISLETHLEKPIPRDVGWIAEETKYPKSSISNDLNMLQELNLVVSIPVTNCDKMSQNVPNITEHNITEHNSNVHFDFESVWSLYPSKVGKKQAKRHFEATVKTDDDLTALQTALKNYKESKRVRAGYVQNGGTWFNNWQDWVESPDKEVADDVPESLRPFIKK